MTMTFPDSFLYELKQKNPIVDVVENYVTLTKRSSNNLFGLCPFHSENTPSFSVSTVKDTYFCFGCGKGGDVIDFIMKIEKLSFPDAVKFLAHRSGLTLPNETNQACWNRRSRLLALNRDAAQWFSECLSSPDGQAGKDYLAKRQISPDAVKAFGIGFAPRGFFALSNAMRAKGYRNSELIEAGLSIANKSGKGVHDVFRNRVIFPIVDAQENIIGFSGRSLGSDSPKYLNTKETSVFKKGQQLFALNLAKKSKNGYALLAEGNVDVVALHQAGFDGAVASLGTNLTSDQAQLLARFFQDVVIAYDNDNAGQKAAKRAIDILRASGINVRILKLDGAKDPDEFIKTRGADAFEKLLRSSKNHVEYLLNEVEQRYDLSSYDGKTAYLKKAAGVIAELTSPVEREVYTMFIAEKTGVEKTAVADEVALVLQKTEE